MCKKRWNRTGLGILLTLLVAGLSGCGLDGVQSTLAPSGPVAARQMEVFLVTFWVSVGIFAVVGSFFAYCIMKFKVTKLDPDAPLPEQGHGGALVEIGLILVSVFLVGVIALPSVQGIFYVGTLPQTEDPLVIKVIGKQWWWQFEYPELGVVTGNEFAMPVGRPVKFELHAPDVIHSFWIPRLGGKMDMMPGQINWLWLEADPDFKGALDLPPDEGRPYDGKFYYGQCAEFCGESHAFMRFRALVLDDVNFEKWVEHQKSDAKLDPAHEVGQKAFVTNQCVACHQIRGPHSTGVERGPDLTHVGSRISLAAGMMDNDATNLKNWIRQPHVVKPGNIMWKEGYRDERGSLNIQSQLTDGDVDALAGYLQSLK